MIGPVQTPEQLRGSASHLPGIPESNIRVDMTRMGGGFGRKLYGNFGLEGALNQVEGGTIDSLPITFRASVEG